MRHLTRLFTVLMLAALMRPALAQISIFATQTPSAPRGTPALTWTNTPVHAGPSMTFEQVALLGSTTEVIVIGRSRAAHWLKIDFVGEDSARAEGWVSLAYLTLPEGFTLADAPIDPDIADAFIAKETDEDVAALLAVPLLPQSIAPEMCALYREGVALGHNPYGITKVGDSNSAADTYLEPLAEGRYELGVHDYLLPTVELFAPHISLESKATRVGMNAMSVFDPFWSSSQCETGETPLACEYRLNAPSFAVIMFGINDTRALNSEQYAAQIEQLVIETLAAKIVPVLVLFTASPDDPQAHQVERFNRITAEIAAEYDVPLVNLWAAAREMTNGGVGSDNVHLTAPGGAVKLGESVSSFGLSLHHLLVLNTLDMLRTTCGILPPVG